MESEDARAVLVGDQVDVVAVLLYFGAVWDVVLEVSAIRQFVVELETRLHDLLIEPFRAICLEKREVNRIRDTTSVLDIADHVFDSLPTRLRVHGFCVVDMTV